MVAPCSRPAGRHVRQPGGGQPRWVIARRAGASATLYRCSGGPWSRCSRASVTTRELSLAPRPATSPWARRRRIPGSCLDFRPDAMRACVGCGSLRRDACVRDAAAASRPIARGEGSCAGSDWRVGAFKFRRFAAVLDGRGAADALPSAATARTMRRRQPKLAGPASPWRTFGELLSDLDRLRPRSPRACRRGQSDTMV
jgi:hypothetical protein